MLIVAVRRPLTCRRARSPATREDWTERDNESMPSPVDPSQPHPARLRVGVIGAGKVGVVLGAALARAGHKVVAVSAVSDASVQRAAAMLPGVPVRRPAAVLAGADLVLLTVPDDALPGLINGLAATEAPVEGRLLAHASGRYGVGVLDATTRLGGLPLALHPVMTFAGRAGRPEPADRDLFRGHRPGRAAPGRGGAGHRDGRRAGLHRRGPPRALPRGPGQRGQPPGHARGPGGRTARHGRRAGPGADAAARC